MNNKKKYIILACTMCVLSFTACGSKDKQSLSENFAGMTDEIQGMDEINAMLSDNQSDVNFLSSEEGANLEGVMSDSSEGSVSDAVVSEDAALSENAVEGDMFNDMGEEGSTVSEEDYFASLVNNNKLNVANLSGRNLKDVYVSFNAGNINNLEITGDKNLNDGNKISYTIVDNDELINADNLILTVNAINKKGETISFGDVKIIDSSNMNVVLTYTDNGYQMYIK